ncbi:MAG: hypothetical protein IT180_14195 [Acidobacteria bacterium]|nr:hypothetical protein [Acidobacteriota bacterium]
MARGHGSTEGILKPGNGHLWIAMVVLFAASIGLQAARDRDRRSFEPAGGMLWLQSGVTVKRLALGYDTVAADLYWMRAVVYYGGQRLHDVSSRNYDLLYPMLDLVTTLDPRFTVAYRFGAIFLTEAYPNGPGRPDLSIALLERGIERDGGRWEYMHDIGFVYYWWLQDYVRAAEWFERAGKAPGAPTWLPPLAATTLAVGGDRQSSRTLWQQLRDSTDIDWIRRNAEHRLRQLDAMDQLDQLNALAERYAAREGHVAQAWPELARGLGLPGIPLDPAGVPFTINPVTGRVGLAADSPLAPLPSEPRSPGTVPVPRRPS